MTSSPVELVSGGAPPPAPHRTRRFHLEMRQHIAPWRHAAYLIAALLVGLALAALILMASGVGPADLVDQFGSSIISSHESVAAVLQQAAPLLIVGLSAAVAFRVRFWNIGIEGQMIFGAIAATAVSIFQVGPPALRLYLMLAAACVAGMLWIALPLALRLRLGVNEIISTLLLNYVAFNFLLHLLYGSWRDPKSSFPNSAQYGDMERLGLIGWENVSYALPLAFGLAVLLWWLMTYSRFGFFTLFAEANPRMARAVGLPVSAVIVVAALISGGLSGVAGFAISAGVEYRMTQSFFVGYGFSGILIAFLARNNPLVAIFASLGVAVLFVAGQSLQVFFQIPGSTVQLIQAVIVISYAASEFFIRHRIHWSA